MKNTQNINTVLEMSLHDLGFNPKNGGLALCFLLTINNEDFELEASNPKRCRRVLSQCISCTNRPNHCNKTLHNLQKISAYRLLNKWQKYAKKYLQDDGCGNCHIRFFLIPPMQKFLNTLMQNGLPLVYIQTEVYSYRTIFQYGSY